MPSSRASRCRCRGIGPLRAPPPFTRRISLSFRCLNAQVTIFCALRQTGSVFCGHRIKEIFWVDKGHAMGLPNVSHRSHINGVSTSSTRPGALHPISFRPPSPYLAPPRVDRGEVAAGTDATRHDDHAVRRPVGSLLTWIWNSAWTLLVLANLFWAGNIIVGRAVLGPVPPIALSFWRWTGAFAIVFWFAWPHLKRDAPVLLAHWRIVLLLAATGMGIFNMVAYVGLAGTTALNVLLLQSSVPLVVTVLGVCIVQRTTHRSGNWRRWRCPWLVSRSSPRMAS